MEFKTFKKSINRTSLYCFILSIVLAIIGIVIVASVAASSLDWTNGPIAKIILFIIDGLLVPLILWMIHMMQGFISVAYVLETQKITTKEKIIKNTKFKNPIGLHIATIIFFIIIYFIEISAMYGAYPNGWIDALKDNWWICLIVFILNVLIVEFAYNFNLYQFNHNQEITNQIED